MDTATPIADTWTGPSSEDLTAVLDAVVDARAGGGRRVQR